MMQSRRIWALAGAALACTSCGRAVGQLEIVDEHGNVRVRLGR